jgi:hypothetical protein
MTTDVACQTDEWLYPTDAPQPTQPEQGHEDAHQTRQQLLQLEQQKLLLLKQLKKTNAQE